MREDLHHPEREQPTEAALPESEAPCQALVESSGEGTEPRHWAQALQSIVKVTAGSGEEFFRALVAELGKVLGVKYALAGVLARGVPERVRTVALWQQGVLVENCEYELAGSPCANVVGKRLCHYPRDVQRLFPRDKMLAEAGMVSYLGIPLCSSAGAALGLLCVMDDRPMPNSELAQSLMTIFAARAASELEREEALKGLRASEAKYRQLHKSLMDAFAAVDLTGRVTDFNEPFRQMLGYEPAELLRHSYRDFTPAKWHAFEVEILEKQVLARGYSDIYEKEYCHKDGTIIPVELRVILLRDDAGTPYGMSAIVRDLTERKRTEETLRQSRKQLRERAEELETIMGSAPVALWVAHDPQCNYISGNWMASSFDQANPPANWSANLSSTLQWFHGGRRLQPEELPMQQAARENREVHNTELGLLLPSGKRVSLLGSAVPLRDAQGRVRGCVGAFLDITERQRADCLLAGEKRVLEWISGRKPLPAVLNEVCRLIEELSPEVMSSILLLEPDGQHLRPIAGPRLPPDWNRAITPLAIGPAIGSCSAAAWGKEQVVVADIATDPRWTRYPDFTALALRCGLRACWSTPILSGEGQLLGTFAMYYPKPRHPLAAELDLIQQVTHLAGVAIEHDRAAEGLRRAHNELEQRVRERTAELAAANKELETFASAVSHDLRAPLRAINGYSQILTLRWREGADEQTRSCLEHLQAETQRMGGLIEALLQLARATRAELRHEAVNLSELAREIERDLRREQPHRQVTWRIAPDLVAQGDPALLRSVLRNLLSNAWKFTAKSPAARIELGQVQRQGKLACFVADNGAGFDMASASQLFVPFHRLHNPAEFPGTGIGLATVRQIIRRHGGDVWAEGTPGKGATFYFTLP